MTLAGNGFVLGAGEHVTIPLIYGALGVAVTGRTNLGVVEVLLGHLEEAPHAQLTVAAVRVVGAVVADTARGVTAGLQELGDIRRSAGIPVDSPRKPRRQSDRCPCGRCTHISCTRSSFYQRQDATASLGRSPCSTHSCFP